MSEHPTDDEMRQELRQLRAENVQLATRIEAADAQVAELRMVLDQLRDYGSIRWQLE